MKYSRYADYKKFLDDLKRETVVVNVQRKTTTTQLATSKQTGSENITDALEKQILLER